MKLRPKHMDRHFWWHLSRSQRKEIRTFEVTHGGPGTVEISNLFVAWDERWWKP